MEAQGWPPLGNPRTLQKPTSLTKKRGGGEIKQLKTTQGQPHLPKKIEKQPRTSQGQPHP